MDSDKREWNDYMEGLLTKSVGNLQQQNHALYYTLKAIYRNNTNQKSAHFMYNDMPPNAEPVNGIFGNEFGATKGILSFDTNGGYWLIHSVPEFPPKQSEGYSYPTKAVTHAHMHLCISMKKNSMDHIWNQLLYMLPYIYDQNVPESFRKEDVVDIVLKNYNMKFRSRKSHQSQEFTSGKGKQFIHFAKSVGFNKEIYDDWILRYLKSDFYVQGGSKASDPIHSSCGEYYEARNIARINIGELEYPSGEDYSKWSISKERGWVCIGDVGRSQRSLKLAGGMMCFKDYSVWKHFENMVPLGNVEKCPHRHQGAGDL